MNATRRINVQALQEAAENSEHKESYLVLAKNRNYRLGVGVRLPSPTQSSFFLEVLVHLCSNDSQVDLVLLEKKLSLLRELQERKYVLNCQNDSSIFSEITVPAETLEAEYGTIESIAKRTFSQTAPPTEE